LRFVELKLSTVVVVSLCSGDAPLWFGLESRRGMGGGAPVDTEVGARGSRSFKYESTLSLRILIDGAAEGENDCVPYVSIC
jgi:hypothetical protein